MTQAGRGDCERSQLCLNIQFRLFNTANCVLTSALSRVVNVTTCVTIDSHRSIYHLWNIYFKLYNLSIHYSLRFRGSLCNLSRCCSGLLWLLSSLSSIYTVTRCRFSRTYQIIYGINDINVIIVIKITHCQKCQTCQVSVKLQSANISSLYGWQWRYGMIYCGWLWQKYNLPKRGGDTHV